MPRKREIWKPVPSLPGVSTSNWGRVRVEPYEFTMPGGGVVIRGGKATYGVWEEDGQRFRFTYRRRSYKVHILVCETWNGPKPFPAAVVMHDDEDGSNNVPLNLKWGTQKENLNYPGFKAGVAARSRARAFARKQMPLKLAP